MHPAPSVIIFTTFSGLGFGLLAFLGLGMPNVTGLTAFVFYTLGYAMAVGGLLASTFHLGHPERAIKAFRQWRSSWLSREAWLAVATLLITAPVAIGRIFYDTAFPVIGLVGAALAITTVYSTSMIYRQLKSIPRWHSNFTPALFLAYAITGGALFAGQTTIALPLLAALAALQILAWINGDQALTKSGTSLASATGLTGKSIRAFEPPHTGTNYLLQEFVHIVGRKHAAKLRIMSLILSTGTPLVLLSIPFHHVLAAIAIVAHVAGVVVARWLFFAQAEHVVGLYYGKR